MRTWLKRLIIYCVVAGAFGTVAAVATFVIYKMEKQGAGREAIETFFPIATLIVAFLIPSAFSLYFICAVAAEWLVDNWTSKKDAMQVRTFPGALEFAKFRRDLLNSMARTTLNDAIYCTSHCNMFKNPDGRNVTERGEVMKVNREFFTQLAMLSMTGKRGGLKLLLQYSSAEEKAGWQRDELGPRIDCFLLASEGCNRDFNSRDFEAVHLLQDSLKDYFVIEDHVFKTIRTTPQAGSVTQYIYIKSEEVAAGYRNWLADLFENGDKGNNQYIERYILQETFRDIRAEATNERAALRVGSHAPNLPLPSGN